MNSYEYSNYSKVLIFEWHLLCQEQPLLLEAENIILELLRKNAKSITKNNSELFYSVYFDWKCLVANTEGWEYLNKENYKDWKRPLLGFGCSNAKLGTTNAYDIAIQYIDVLWRVVCNERKNPLKETLGENK